MRIGLLILCVMGCSAATQEFEVASVKPAAPQGPGRRMVGMRGGPGTPDPGRVTFSNASLSMLLGIAYDVKNYQVNGPAWMETESFEISAKVPAGATKEQMHEMLQNLLTERFHLALHHDTKEMQGYELSVGKNGPKLKTTDLSETDASAAPTPPQGPPKMDAKGFPVMAGPGMMWMMMAGPKGVLAHGTAKAQPISQLVTALANQLHKPVVDRTGLTGKYDFNLEFGADTAGMGMPPPGPPRGGEAGPSPSGEEAGPDIMTAVREQLGLKLEAKKLPVDILIIDKLDKVPTEN